MTKELTPLEALKNLTGYLTGSYRDCFEELSIIENALYELEGLKKVYKVAKDYEEELTKDRDYWRDKAYKKQLKALEIIKEKKVDIVGVLLYAFKEEDGCEFYNSYMPKEEYKLTQEEYDLLKEVLL